MLTIQAMTTFYLLRHGETEWNEKGRWQGHSDLALNDRGREQARESTSAVLAAAPEFAFSSDLKRAAETAAIVTSPLKLSVPALASLREAHFGAWEGLSKDQIIERFPEDWRRRTEDVVNYAPPGGESLRALARRMSLALRDLADAHQGRRVLVVTHGFAIAAVRVALAREPLENACVQIPKNCALTEIPWPESGCPDL